MTTGASSHYLHNLMNTAFQSQSLGAAMLTLLRAPLLELLAERMRKSSPPHSHKLVLPPKKTPVQLNIFHQD